MPEVIVDANVVLDARNSNAKRHDIAAEIFGGIDRGDLPRARLVNYVIPEILHPIQKRISKSAATETLELLQESRGFEFVHIPKGIHPKGERLFRLHESSSPSG